MLESKYALNKSLSRIEENAPAFPAEGSVGMVAVLNQQAIDARETLKGIHMDAQAAALESFAQGQGPVELLEAALYKAGFGVEAFAGLVTRGDSGQERHVPLPAQEWNQSAVNIQVRARAFIPTED